MFHFVSLLRRMFTPREKLQFVGIVLLMVVSALLEMAGVGLLVGVAALVLVPGSEIVASAQRVVGIADRGMFTLAALVVTGAAVIAKNAFVFLLCRIWSSFVYSKGEALCVRLFGNYLRADYSTMVARPTSELNANIVRVNLLVANVLIPAISALGDIIVILVLAAVLAVGIPWIAVFGTLFMTASGAAVYGICRRINSSAGRELYEADLAADEVRQSCLADMKFIKAEAKEDVAIFAFAAAQRRRTAPQSVLYRMGQLPRLSLDGAAVVLLLAVFIVMFLMHVENEHVLLSFSLILAALSRLLPSFSRLHYNLTLIRQNRRLLDKLAADLLDIVRESSGSGADMRLNDALRFDDVSFMYDGKPLIDHMSFAVARGEIVGVGGPTGSGKTTLCDIMLGLLRPDSGRVLVDGRDISESPAAWRRHVGYVPQRIFLMDGTVRSNVAFGVPEDAVDDDRVRECLGISGAMEFVSALPGGLGHGIGPDGCRLSGGQRQRLALARALYDRPDILVLDGPTSALDAESESAVVEALEKLRGDVTVVVISHSRAVLDACDKVVAT
ncbi:MAG: ABC transporter ATP-binding protein/permease [Victivallaceae bacterium]|nr:ABC transporter ATP-binding protein/permease [Victivallaceae bacterium]